KKTTPEEVQAQYERVFRLDRVGRLLDAQPFRYLRFPAGRLDPALLAELRESCAASVVEEGDDVVLKLCYVQRRLRPLDLYVRGRVAEERRQALLDYGQAIVDLARNDIFPGDMLLKNFGVSRHRRVVFYDYDEIRSVSELEFREWPQATTYEEQVAAEPWF